MRISRDFMRCHSASIRMECGAAMIEKIDFVIPWVDSNDHEWQREKDCYSGIITPENDNRDIRFRDWETLKYWFRGVDRYAPWVNKIHFITWGHLPKWLNTNHPKLHIVNHKDYIPNQYLPTFSSHVIELNMHRIPGLSDHFVYFNDDIFILKPLSEKDFFIDGVPCDLCVANAITPRLGEFSPILLQTTSYINKHFRKRQDIKKNFGKWFSLKYGSLLIRTICLLPWTFHTGFYNHHLAVAYEKKTLESVWNEEPEILDQTCSHRFRNDSDVNQYIFRYWRLASGNFVPHRILGKYMNIGDNNAEIYKAIRYQSYKLLCINDKEGIDDFEAVKEKLTHAFETVFPDRCDFEITI